MCPGEEVDWYVCNVGAYHVARARDASAEAVEDALLKRLLLQVEDAVLVRQAAMAAGQQALKELERYYTERQE